MKININGQLVDVEWIRIHRVAGGVAFFRLVEGRWVYFHKHRDKRLPTFRQVQWPNPNHMYGWSEPYRLPED